MLLAIKKELLVWFYLFLLNWKIIETTFEIVLGNRNSNTSNDTWYIAINFIPLSQNQITSRSDNLSTKSQQFKIVIFGKSFDFSTDNFALNWQSTSTVYRDCKSFRVRNRNVSKSMLNFLSPKLKSSLHCIINGPFDIDDGNIWTVNFSNNLW